MTDARPSDLAARFAAVRRHTLALAAPLSAEDQCVQSMPDASPTKWHLAHTTWFFETLAAGRRTRRATGPSTRASAASSTPTTRALGPRHPRPQRGLLTRPSLAEVHAYRAAVDAAMRRFIAAADERHPRRLVAAGRTGPAARAAAPGAAAHRHPARAVAEPAAAGDARRRAAAPCRRPRPAGSSMPGGEVGIGHAGAGFAFDNETPRHAVLLQPFAHRPTGW